MTNIVSALEAEEEKTLIVPPNDRYERHAIFPRRECFEDEGEESVIDEPINLPILTNAVLRERERQRRKDEIQ